MSAVAARAFGVRAGGRALCGPLDLDVPDRGLVLLQGPSGSGKSTLLRAVAGILPPHAEPEGDLRVLGRPAPRAFRPDEVALVPQDPREALLATDVLAEVCFRLENLGVPEAEGLARAKATLARFGLASFAARESSTLSGGEARRVAIAAATAARPRLLLLDEPFTGLDAAWRGAVAEDVRALADETAVVVAEHRSRELRPDAVARLGEVPLAAR